MTQLVKIAGVEVDADDPCALWNALFSVKLKRLAGEQIAETEIRSPVGQRRIKVADVSMNDLEAELTRLADACQAKQNGGRCRPSRRRLLRY